ncbi:hypothetical protein [Actinoplanes subtropicus]|uniref:hypothetical protein n=1 Tax=Actinoplanes subtropicus TaxID=543632 RepID=UPI000691E66E|nr:hypothetical protein [Actinoplanes subtropicus]
MRTRTVAVVLLALALGPAACARSGTNDPQVASAQTAKPKATTSASASAAAPDPDAPLKFSKCMRDHGISWFPDPSDGKMSVMIPKGQDAKKLEAAQEACKQYMPDGGEMHKPSAEELQEARDMAKCMRENGVPNFPDPNPDGGISIDPKKLGTGPDDPLWKKAEKACEQYAPKGHVQQGAVGGTTNLGRAG